MRKVNILVFRSTTSRGTSLIKKGQPVSQGARFVRNLIKI